VSTSVGSTTTFFVGGHYEVVVTDTGTQVNKYYFAGTQRIAMRKDTTLYYLLSDHLGSTSIVTDAAGTVVSQTRYKAWGEVRHQSGVTPTEYGFTGQYSHTADFGLMFYNARWYDVSLGRFAQADSIIPPGVQGLDRYAYVNNSPMNYVDPSGHVTGNPCEALGRCLENDKKNLWKDSDKTPINKPSKRTRTPGEILGAAGAAGPTNQMVTEINNFMQNNPNYDPAAELSGWSLGAFQDIRRDYWRHKAIEAGVCNICIGESNNLYAYYDLHLNVTMTGWDSSNVNWRNVGLDSLATVLSFVALNEVAQSLKITEGVRDFASIGVGVYTIKSGADAYVNNDAVGFGLSAAGLVPGLVGGVASGASVLRDLSAGVYYYDYVPSVQR
jgi:RHS repeat-associated protein